MSDVIRRATSASHVQMTRETLSRPGRSALAASIACSEPSTTTRPCAATSAMASAKLAAPHWPCTTLIATVIRAPTVMWLVGATTGPINPPLARRLTLVVNKLWNQVDQLNLSIISTCAVNCVRMFSKEAPYGRAVVLDSRWPCGHPSGAFACLACMGLEQGRRASRGRKHIRRGRCAGSLVLSPAARPTSPRV